MADTADDTRAVRRTNSIFFYYEGVILKLLAAKRVDGRISYAPYLAISKSAVMSKT